MTTPTDRLDPGVEALAIVQQLAAGAITTDEATTLHERLDAADKVVKALDKQVTAIDEEIDEQDARLAVLDAEVAVLRDRPLFRLPPESTGFLKRLQSKKFLVTVAGVPIAWVASKLGVPEEVVIAGVGALIAYLIGQSAVDTATAKAAKPPAPPTPPGG